jgi:hypothetical protein
MLLSVKHKFLFVHIAKTGGTSIRQALNPYRYDDIYRIPQFLCSKLSALTGHRIGAKLPRHAKAIAAQEMLPSDFYQALYKFAFVRNPWDLQVSSFHHLKKERPQLVAHVDDFESFLNWKFDPERPPQYHADISIALQSDYVIDLHNNLIVDFIGRYENLTEDFRQVCQHLGLNCELPHKRKAATRDKDFRSYYNDRTAELIQTHYQADIERFAYHFDRP